MASRGLGGSVKKLVKKARSTKRMGDSKGNMQMIEMVGEDEDDSFADDRRDVVAL